MEQEKAEPESGDYRNIAGPSAIGSLAPSEKGLTTEFSSDLGLLRNVQTVIPVVVLLAAVVGFYLFAGPNFLSPLNLSLILQQVTVIALLSIAQTLVILTAGIDLSVGAIMLLSSVIMGRLSIALGLPQELGVLAGVAAGMLCGAFNGILVARLKLPPFIATLGSWSIFSAMVLLVSNSATIRSQDVRDHAPLLQWLGTTVSLGGGFVITLSSLLTIALAVGVWYLLKRTAFGRHIYATGDDPLSAELSGVNTRRTLLAVYVLAGVLCGVAGWVLIGRIGAVSPFGALSSNLDAITAVIIGGTSLFGGRGSISGSLIGALIVGVFRNGLALAGVDVLWQEFAVGALIIIAVIVDQGMRRIST